MELTFKLTDSEIYTLDESREKTLLYMEENIRTYDPRYNYLQKYKNDKTIEERAKHAIYLVYKSTFVFYDGRKDPSEEQVKHRLENQVKHFKKITETNLKVGETYEYVIDINEDKIDKYKKLKELLKASDNEVMYFCLHEAENVIRDRSRNRKKNKERRIDFVAEELDQLFWVYDHRKESTKSKTMHNIIHLEADFLSNFDVKEAKQQFEKWKIFDEQQKSVYAYVKEAEKRNFVFKKDEEKALQKIAAYYDTEDIGDVFKFLVWKEYQTKSVLFKEDCIDENTECVM